MALSSVTQHDMPPDFGRKWGTECLNTRFSMVGPAVCVIQRKAEFSTYCMDILLLFYPESIT